MVTTQDLATAPQHPPNRDEYQPRWIYAVCVSQKDLEERAQQVEIMVNIYKLAERIIIWLGPEVDDHALAIKILSLLGSKCGGLVIVPKSIPT